MYYDLHIHSALSPCAEDDMTLNNIINMAFLKGLQLIAVTDHNSMRQLKHLPKIAEGKIDYVYGVEIQSREEVHVLGYFKKDADIEKVQEFLDEYLILEPNDEYYFGNQLILTEEDEVEETEWRLLLKSLDLSLEEVIQHIHRLGGVAVLAHAMDTRFSIMQVFYDIDPALDFDGIETKTMEQQMRLKEMYPDFDTTWLISSDAHRLWDMNEAVNDISPEEFYGMWRKRYG